MLHIICNPISGSGRTAHCLSTVEGLLNARAVDYVVHKTHSQREAADIARELSTADDPHIVVMGGDGTLHEVLNGLVDPARVFLGLIPTGSGNDFAAVAGIPSDPNAALSLILDGRAKPTDYMECSGVRGINAIGTGIDVDILRRYARMKLLKGSAAYLASLIITLFTYHPYDFEVITPDAPEAHRAFIACAGNGSRIGGGIPICPKASIDDGLIDIVIVDDIQKHNIPGALVKLLRRRVLELPTTTFRRQEHLQLRSSRTIPIQIDGEIYENLPFDVHIIKGGVMVYRP